MKTNKRYCVLAAGMAIQLCAGIIYMVLEQYICVGVPYDFQQIDRKRKLYKFICSGGGDLRNLNHTGAADGQSGQFKK